MDQVVVGTVAMDRGVVSTVVVDWVVPDALVDQGVLGGTVDWIVAGGLRLLNSSGLRLVQSLFWMLEY